MKSPQEMQPVQVGSHSTCLFCYFPFQVARASGHCPRCGEINLKADQRLYWTREPKLVRTEATLKGIIAVLISGLMALMLVASGGFGLGQGWAIGLPLLLGWLLWETAGLVTRRRAALNMRIAWPMLFIGVGVGPTLFFGILMLITDDSFDGTTRMFEVLGDGVLWTLPWLVPAGFCVLLADGLARMREERIAAGAMNGAFQPPDGVS